MDKYLGFSYRGIRLGMDNNADFNGFIENSGEDLIFNNSPEFSNEFATVPFGNQTFYLGNSKTNRTFDFRVNLIEITLNDYRRFLNWLDLDSKGTLIFDYNENYGFDVKVNSIGSGQYTVITRCDNNRDLYNVGIDLSFITTERYTARWIGSEVEYTGAADDVLADNEEGIDFVEKINNIYTFKNRHAVENGFIVNFTGELRVDNFKMGSAGITGTYYSEYGICIDSSGTFIPINGITTTPFNPKIVISAYNNKSVTMREAIINWIKPTSYEII